MPQDLYTDQYDGRDNYMIIVKDGVLDRCVHDGLDCRS